MSAEKYVIHDDEHARLVAEFWKGRVVLHLLVRQWGMETMRMMRERWPEVKLMLRRIGFDVVYAYNEEKNSERWIPFMRHFGFSELRRKDGFILMEMKNGSCGS